MFDDMKKAHPSAAFLDPQTGDSSESMNSDSLVAFLSLYLSIFAIRLGEAIR
jgi:hypothetical protein